MQVTWITASAGSGKTQSLMNHMIALMLEGCAPRHILCLTLTRAAAKEMQERLPQHLNQITQDSGRGIHERAQTLQGILSYESPKIQTIHGFCQRILHPFFLKETKGVLEEGQALALWEKAKEDVLARLSPDSLEGQVVLRLLRKGKKKALDLGFERRDVKLLHDFQRKDAFAIKLLLPQETFFKTERERAFLQQYSQMSHAHSSPFSMPYLELFFTKQGTERKSFFKNPEVQSWFFDMQRQLKVFLDQEHQRLAWQEEKDMQLIFHAIKKSYEHHKNGALDFADLIEKTRDLLQNPQSMGWVTHQICMDTHHILVDEAQDTNRMQWEIIQHIAEALISAAGNSIKRSVFIVGDPKQSIYGFQGADPKAFFETKTFLKQCAHYAGVSFKEISLAVSYRSVPEILSVVNHVFAKHSLTPEPFPKHRTHHKGHGLVELWDHTWEDPQALARYWAHQIQQWLEHPFFLETQGRRLQESDILLILPRRSSFFNLLHSTLCEKGFLLAPSRPMMLRDHEAIQDLMTLGVWLFNPHDDATLLSLLRGSLFRCPEALIFQWAYQRDRLSLWKRLCLFPDALGMHERLATWKTSFQTMSPYSFFMHVLYGENGLKRMENHLPRAQQMTLALAIEKMLELWHYAENSYDLNAFFATLKTSSLPLDVTPSLQGLRLQTIHGAKGTQAPVVILPDLPSLLSPRQFQEKRSEEEGWRLLYVAMTRAQDRLYLSTRYPRKGTWFPALRQTMEELGAPCLQDGKQVLRLSGLMPA